MTLLTEHGGTSFFFFFKCLWFKNLFIHFHMLRKGWRIVLWEEPLETERRCVHADVRCSSQWMSSYCTTLCFLVVVKTQEILSSDYSTVLLRHAHTHTHTSALLLVHLLISQASISKPCLHWPISVCPRWAGLHAALLLDEAEWEVPLPLAAAN